MPVELGMSGETLRCTCGAAVEVPTLRVLRDMPRTDELDEGPGWTWRHGVLVLGAMIAAFGISMALYFIRNQYKMQPEKTWDEWQQHASAGQDWRMWHYYQKDGISGGMRPRPPELLQLQMMFFNKLHENQKLLDKQREWIYLASAVGALGLLMMASTLFFPARTKVGLPGLKSVEMTPTKSKSRRA